MLAEASVHYLSPHTYRLEADTATNAARGYRDGVLVITHHVISAPALYPVFFGDGTSTGGDVTEWRRISHNLPAKDASDGRVALAP